jgi:hypothetical protein
LITAAALLVSVASSVEAQDAPARSALPYTEQGALDATAHYDHRYRHIWKAGCWQQVVTGGLNTWDPNCLGNPNEEQNNREVAKRTQHWIMAGLLTAAQLYQGFEYAKSTYQGFKALADDITWMLRGFDKKAPEQSAVRLGYSLDRFDRRMDHLDFLNMSYRSPIGGRYDAINLMISRSLLTARTTEETALSLSDQAVAMQLRLQGGQLNVRVVGDEESRLAIDSPPPLPLDAPENPGGGMPSGVAGPGWGPVDGVGGPMMIGASNGPMLTGYATESMQCQVPDADDRDSEVIYQRAIAQATGAQAVGGAVAGEALFDQEALRMVAIREEQAEQASFLQRILRLLFSL